MKGMFLREGRLIWPLLVSAIIHAGVFLPAALHMNNEIAFEEEPSYITLNIVSSPAAGNGLGPTHNTAKTQAVNNHRVKSMSQETRAMIVPEEKIEKKVEKKIAVVKQVAKKDEPAEPSDNRDVVLQKESRVENVKLHSSEESHTLRQMKKAEAKEAADGTDLSAQAKDLSQSTGVLFSGGNSKNNKGSHNKNGKLTSAAVRGLSKPEYPRYSRVNGEEGTVVLAVEISSVGSPVEIEVVSSSGYRRLDRAAVRALEKARFIPSRIDGKTIASKKRIAFRFNLKD